jgi:hypothetical protein
VRRGHRARPAVPAGVSGVGAARAPQASPKAGRKRR